MELSHQRAYVNTLRIFNRVAAQTRRGENNANKIIGKQEQKKIEATLLFAQSGGNR